MMRNEMNDMPIVPGIPQSPMSMRIAQRMVIAQQHAVMVWMTVVDNFELLAGCADAEVKPPNGTD